MAEIISFSLVPLNPCVGDRVTAKIVFCADAKGINTNEHIAKAFNALSCDTNDFLITDTNIATSSDGNSVLTVNFIPWQSGSIQLPAAGDITIPPITVASVFPNGTLCEELRPPLGPLLSPITIHTLYASVAMGIVLLAALCVAVSKRQSIRVWFILRKLEARERRNERALKKRLAVLSKSHIYDAVFCTELQQTIRAYLETRFGENFKSFTTGEVAAKIWNKTVPTSSNEAEDAYNALFDVMRRTDYVRFAGEESGGLVAHEREKLIQETLNASAVLGGRINA